MNYRMLIYTLRNILFCEGLLMLLPAATALIYRELDGLYFLGCTLFCILVSFPFKLRRPKNSTMRLREGFVAVALSWIVMSIVGSLPFFLSGHIPNPVDALFETVSGFTTTGASILTDVGALPHCMLIWRSFTHWIGGMGVLVFILALMPAGDGNRMNLMRAESPGPSVDKLVPKVQSTAKILYSIYIVMTLVQIIILIIGGMPVFDSIAISFGTAGTGGFGVNSNLLSQYSEFSQVVITVFMILFGVNFNAYFLILTRRFKRAFKLEEVLVYFGIIATAITLITVNIYNIYGNFGDALRNSAFQVGSIITTTGYATADFNLWPQMSRTILVMLMFIGACAGSTGGGIKVSRFIILAKTIKKELNGYVHPNAVKKVKMDDRTISHETVRSVNVFLIAYFLLFALSVLIVTLDGKDLVTNFTAVASTINNIGPGLEVVGPTGSFSSFSSVSKLVLIFDMLAGRLEIFPMLLLLYPKSWKKF